jgi:hypothetical protein
MEKHFYFTIFFLTFFISVTAQSRLFFQHQEKPGRQKKIDQKWDYNIVTMDTAFNSYHLLDIDNDNLIISQSESGDMVALKILDIKTIEKKIKFGVFDAIGTLGVIMLSITPVVWAFEGNQEALGTLEAAGGLLAISVPFLAIREIGRKKNMEYKWKICAE